MSINKPSSANNQKTQSGKKSDASPIAKASDNVSERVHRILKK